MQFRKALIDEADALSALAFRSEAFWGYDSSFMAKFEEIYRLTPETISMNTSEVMLYENRVVGFYLYVIGPEAVELEYFYVEPGCIGQGFGRALWKRLIQNMKAHQIDHFSFVTSPQAVGFYEKMGAFVVGEMVSQLVTGRMVPKLEYTCSHMHSVHQK